MKNSGFWVRMFMPDADPDGLKTVEKSNWSGLGLLIPRPLYSIASGRKECNSPGVYVLVGSSSESQMQKIYVGEGDPVRDRLNSHIKTKDFWTTAVVFTSLSQGLNKAHIQYLEARLLELSKQAKKCVIDNSNSPQRPSLSEPDEAQAEAFLENTLLCLSVLGYSFFQIPSAGGPSVAEYVLNGRGIQAKGYISSSGFVVRSRSCAAKTQTDSLHGYLSELRASLILQGVLAEKGEKYELIQDYEFGSPSTAAGVMLGRVSNGRADWKTEDGKTLGAVEEGKVTS